MGTKLYVRSPKNPENVSGPFSRQELQDLVAKNSLEPKHEVSVDGKKWVLASKVKPTLFHDSLKSDEEEDIFDVTPSPRESTTNPKSRREQEKTQVSVKSKKLPVIILSLGGVGGLVVVGLAIIAGLVFFRSQARRAMTKNNMKQIGIALHMYHEQLSVFPPGAVIDSEGVARHGWQTFLLPYIEHDGIYSEIDFNQPWDHPSNSPHFHYEIPVYLNPAISKTKDERGFGLSHYSGNSYLFSDNSSFRISDIRDGTSNTMIVGEINSNFKPWGQPKNWRDLSSGLNKGTDSFGTSSEDGAHFIFADGSVHFISNEMDTKMLKLIATPNEGIPLTEALPISD